MAGGIDLSQDTGTATEVLNALAGFMPVTRNANWRATFPHGRRSVTLDGTPDGVTNNNTAIATALATINAMTRSESNRAVLVIPAGTFNFTTPFTVPTFTDFVMVDGAELYYTGTDRSQAAVTAGGPDLVQESYGNFVGINIRCITNHQWWPIEYGGTVSPDYFAGFRLRNMFHGHVQVKKISGFYIGLQLYPGTSTGAHAVCYCTVQLGELASNKIPLDLRGSINDGFVNENLFLGGNFFSGSAMYNYGTCHAIRMSADAGGYTGNNNNDFIKPCFQNGTANIGNGAWTASLAVVAGRHVHFEGRDYLVTISGTLDATTGPVHTSGTATNGTATLQYMELYRRSVLLYDNAGLYNRINDCRREGGLGSPIIVRGTTFGNETEMSILYQANVLTPPSMSQGYMYDVEVQGATGTLCKGITARARALINSATDTRNTVLTDIHKRLIKGTTAWGGPGVYMQASSFTAPGAALALNTAAATLRLCVDGIINDGVSMSPIVVIPVTAAWAKVLISPIRDDAESDLPRYRLWALDADKKVLANTTADSLKLLVNAGARHATLHSQAGESDSALTHTILPTSTLVKFIAIQFDLGCFKGFNVTQLQTLVDSSIATAPPSILGHNSTNRFSIGTPTVGIFETLGEFIANAAFAGTGSPGWYVSTVGVLCPDWVTATAVKAGEFRKNGGRVYYAAASGTTGATAPVHTTGSASDDVVNWVYYSPVAAVTAAASI